MSASAHPGDPDRLARRTLLLGLAGGSAGSLGVFQHLDQTLASRFNPVSVVSFNVMEGLAVDSTNEHYALPDEAAEAIWFLGCLALIKGVGASTAGAFSTVEFMHPPRFSTPLHVHHDADEAFYVLAGEMSGVCGEQEWRAQAGSFVWLPQRIPHGYRTEGDQTLRTLAFAMPSGFDRFIIEAGEPAGERELPPPSEPDIDKLVAVGLKYGIENVGPPLEFNDLPTPESR